MDVTNFCPNCEAAGRALEAARKENAELRAALDELHQSRACWYWQDDEVAHWTEVDGNTDSFVAPHLAAYLRGQEQKP